MPGKIIFIFLILSINVLINSFIFWRLLNKGVEFFRAVKIICIAGAMNKLLLTGSGYAAMSWKLKSDDFPVSRSISAFAIFELFSVSPWLISGFYFGAEASVRMPSFLLFIMGLVFILAIYKIRKTKNFLKDALSYFKDSTRNIPLIIPLVLINVILLVIYYQFLFRGFGVNLPLIEIFKIIAIAFTVGYLSPAPSGLGFKEGSLVFLLMQRNLSLKSSLSIAITDRLITTILYAILGFSLGAKMIKNTLRERFKNWYFVSWHKVILYL